MKLRRTVLSAFGVVLVTLATAVSPASAAPIRYEAEDAVISAGTVDSNHSGYSGTGFANTDNGNGVYVEWTVTAAAAGNATLTFRFANGNSPNRPADITVNGTVAADELAFTSTGAWNSWQTQTIQANLPAGTSKIRLTATTSNGAANLDYLDLESDTGGPPQETLLSQGKPATSSSEENSTLTPDKAVDGNTSTRWASAEGSDPQWLAIDLQATATVTRVNLNWEAAYASAYRIEASSNGTSWTTVYSTSNGDGGIDDITGLNATARHIRIYGTQRGTPYGYSLWEAQVYGTTDGGGDTQDPSVPANPRVTSTTSSSISLAWDASTDNVGVTGYRVYEGGSVADTPTGTSTTITGLAPSTSHTYRITAVDAAGNESGLSASVTGTTQPGGGTGTPVEDNGQLHVCGTKLCNQDNVPIQLRGMSTHGTQWYPQCVNSASMDALADDWEADVIRISTYVQEDGYETDPDLFTQRAHDFIDLATARGLYVIVDWHMLDPGDPNVNLSLARTFFTEIAQVHGDQPNLLYEVANEPNGVSWSSIKSYHEQIIPTIRNIDANSVILLGTRAWSSLGVSDGADESEVINNPVNASNVMYTFHFYAASHLDEYLNALDRASDVLPIFVTEFGTQNYAGEGANDFVNSQRYLDLMESKQIGWTNWNYSDDNRSGAVFESGTCPGGPYAGTSSLKEAGVWIRARIKEGDV